jgi:hypothetical protein
MIFDMMVSLVALQTKQLYILHNSDEYHHLITEVTRFTIYQFYSIPDNYLLFIQDSCKFKCNRKHSGFNVAGHTTRLCKEPEREFRNK